MKPEETLQASIVDYVRKCCPGVMAFASMNGMHLGRNSNAAVYITKMKKLGMFPGEPDLRLHWNAYDIITLTDKSKTLYLECKIKPNKPTEAQANCMADLTGLGFPCEVVYSLDEALEAFKIHGVPMRKVS